MASRPITLLPAPKIKKEQVECGLVKNRSDLYEIPMRDHSPVDYYLTIDPSNLKKKTKIGLMIKFTASSTSIFKYLPSKKVLPLSQNDLAIMEIGLDEKNKKSPDKKIIVQYMIDGQLSEATVVSLKDLRCSEPEQK